MNTQMDRSRSHTDEYDPLKHDQQDGGPGGVHIGHAEEHHGEKQSVLKKVKAKARKIKDSIKEHVGHGHEHDHDDEDDDGYDDEDDAMDTETHGTRSSESFVPANEGVGRRTAAEGDSLGSKPGDYQTFDPTTARYTPGQDETSLGWSRTDTGRRKESQEHPYAPRNSPAVSTHLAGGRSTGDLETGNRGGHLKLGGLTGRTMGDVEEDPQAPKHAWEDQHPANYQAKVADPTSIGYDSTAFQGSVPEGHGSKLGERTAMEGIRHVPINGPQGDHQSFDTNPASYVVGQEATLDWPSTDTRMPSAEEVSYAAKDTPSEAHSGYAAQSLLPGQQRSNLGERSAMGGIIRDPTSEPLGQYQTFALTAASHIPGKEDNLGWSGTDAGMLKGSEEMSNNPKYTPITAHLGSTHDMGAEGRNIGKRGGVVNNSTHLENDPRAPRDSGSTRYAENYKSNINNPTGRGGEGIGVTPVLHQLDRMNIHGDAQQKQNIRSSQEESMFEPRHSPRDKNISTGSHDQFYPEPVTSVTGKFLETPESESQLGDEGRHDKSEQTQGSYTGKISSAAAMVADKAKQATNSVTSKLGYGGSSDQQPPAVQQLDEKHSEPGGYGEKISIATAVVADKAVQAKDVVAAKLGYGSTHKEQPVQGESKGGSVVETVKGTIGPMYGKVAGMGSAMASKVQGSGTQHEVGPTTTPNDTSGGTDKGVSMKEYLVEKLKPGEDDRALSKVITEAMPLHKHKEDVSGAEEGEEGNKVPIKGRVTESEEVARRLGRSEDTSYDEAGTGLSSPGKGVIDRIKDAATSWYQKTGVSPAEDIKGKEGSSSIMTNEDDGADGQYKVTKGSVNI